MVSRQVGSLREIDKAARGVGGGGKFVQSVITTLTTASSNTTALPFDTTIPQNTEGAEILTRAITPTSATNRLLIECVLIHAGGTDSTGQGMALFQDTTANALASAGGATSGGDATASSILRYEMAAGTISETTFKIRVGTHNGAAFYVNRSVDVATLHGGKVMSSLRVTEIAG
jgi:hypothetical protein